MATSDLLLTLPAKSTDPVVTLPSLLTSSHAIRPDSISVDSSAFSVSPKSPGNALLSSWLQGTTLRGTAPLLGTCNGCVLPPVGELQRSAGSLEILSMLNCSRLQGGASPDNFIDFSLLPKVHQLDHSASMPEAILPHLSVAKVKLPFVEMKNSGSHQEGPPFELDGSVQNISSQTSNSLHSGATSVSSGFVETLTAAGSTDLNLSLTGGDQAPNWNDVATLGIPKEWNTGTQDINALLSSSSAFPDFSENVFAQCMEDIHCFKCKFCSGMYIGLSKDDAIAHLAANHSKEVELLQRGDSSWMDLMPRDFVADGCLEASTPVEMPAQGASFVCGKCHKTFVSLKDCQNHMSQVHQVKSSRIREDKGCRALLPQQETKVAKKKDVKLKVMSKKRKKREMGCYICEFKGCNVRFRLLDNLQYHYKCHVNGGSTFACPECSSSAQRWSSLANHLWRQHVVDLELHACDQCSFRTYNLSLLENLHKRTHGEERPFLCDTCGKSFKTNKQLRSHKVLHLRKHSGAHGSQSGDACMVCRRRFLDKRMLRVHLDMVHRKMKPFLCNYCGYAASSKSTLRMHLRQHTGEKPFACQECDYRTADHNSLRRHKMRHSGEKPYKCPHCPYACIQSSTYKSHLKTKHPGQDKGLMFSCNLCAFQTIKEDIYLTHVAEHSLGSLPAGTRPSGVPQQFLPLVEAVHISIAQPGRTQLRS